MLPFVVEVDASEVDMEPSCPNIKVTHKNCIHVHTSQKKREELQRGTLMSVTVGIRGVETLAGGHWLTLAVILASL